jgi:cytochrome c556
MLRKEGMQMRYVLFVVLFLITLVGACSSEAGGVDKEAAQEAMRTYIDAKMAKGGGPYDIQGTKAEFDYIHSGVKKKGDFYVSCADFKAGGDVYDIDYYVKSDGEKYVVVKELFHKKNGKKVNEELWKE